MFNIWALLRTRKGVDVAKLTITAIWQNWISSLGGFSNSSSLFFVGKIKFDGHCYGTAINNRRCFRVNRQQCFLRISLQTMAKYQNTYGNSTFTFAKTGTYAPWRGSWESLVDVTILEIRDRLDELKPSLTKTMPFKNLSPWRLLCQCPSPPKEADTIETIVLNFKRKIQKAIFCNLSLERTKKHLLAFEGFPSQIRSVL